MEKVFTVLDICIEIDFKKMLHLKYYSPIRLIYGLIIQVSAFLKAMFAFLFFSKKKVCVENLKKKGFATDNTLYEKKNFNDIHHITKSFKDNNNLRSVVNGDFKEWTSKSTTHYLIPDIKVKKSLIQILDDTNVISKISSHHGFEFYCRGVSVFKTEADEDSGITSTRFHRDGHPLLTYKLMVYLTNVDRESGAFSIIPNSVQKYMIPTFGSYNYNRNMSEGNYKDFSILGDKGTAILFNNNSLHAGGRTTQGERIVAVYILHPRFSSKLDNSIESINWSVGGREYGII